MSEITETMRRYMRAMSAVYNVFNPTDEQWEEFLVAEQAAKDEPDEFPTQGTDEK